MTFPALEALAIKQIAFVVPNLREAAQRHSACFGSGPYFIAEGVNLAGHIYRGTISELDMDVAFTQFGDLQLELIQLNDNRPSIFREIVTPGHSRPLLHHICAHPADLDEGIEGFRRAGADLVFDYTLPGGTRAVMMDTSRQLGHFVELYQRTDEIAFIYDGVRKAAGSFAPDSLFRPLVELFQDPIPDL